MVSTCAVSTGLVILCSGAQSFRAKHSRVSKSKRDKKKPDTKRKEDTEKPGTQAEVKAKKRKLYRVTYELELARLQVELVKMKEWIAAKKL